MKKVLFCALCVLGLASVSFSGVVSVKNLTFSLPGTFYYVNGNFQLNASGSADLQTYDAATSFYDYSIENVAITISSCALDQDRSTAQGQAIGDFFGGGTLTVTGDLMQANNGDPFGPVLYSGQILEAPMVLSDTDTWTLSETAWMTSIVSATTGLTHTGAGLSSGISLGADTMFIGDMNLKLQFITPGISEFGAGDHQSSPTPIVQIAAAEVPEPATLLLLGLGGLGFISRKRK